jgi:type IV fimbrial biogenesis protein FimT
MENPGRRRVAGFTLGELMLTLLILVVVAALAAPSYREIIRSARLTTQIHDFSAALNLARSEAVKRGYKVTVCPSTDQATCAGGTQWETGWIVFVDVDGDQTVDTSDTREVVLRATPALASGYTLRGTASSSVATHVTADPKGQLSDTGEFMLCENLAPNPARAVLVTMVGRIAIAANEDGVPIDALGNDMTDCTP